MLAILAVIIFAIAFIIRVTATTTDAVFAPASLVILGLICVALHLAGLGPAGACAASRPGTGTAAGLRLPAAVPLYGGGLPLGRPGWTLDRGADPRRWQ